MATWKVSRLPCSCSLGPQTTASCDHMLSTRFTASLAKQFLLPVMKSCNPTPKSWRSLCCLKTTWEPCKCPHTFASHLFIFFFPHISLGTHTLLSLYTFPFLYKPDDDRYYAAYTSKQVLETAICAFTPWDAWFLRKWNKCSVSTHWVHWRLDLDQIVQFLVKARGLQVRKECETRSLHRTPLFLKNNILKSNNQIRAMKCEQSRKDTCCTVHHLALGTRKTPNPFESLAINGAKWCEIAYFLFWGVPQQIHASPTQT